MKYNQFYDSELLISMIRKHCNNHDDLSKIINACECLKEALYLPENAPQQALTVDQLLLKTANEKIAVSVV